MVKGASRVPERPSAGAKSSPVRQFAAIFETRPVAWAPRQSCNPLWHKGLDVVTGRAYFLPLAAGRGCERPKGARVDRDAAHSLPMGFAPYIGRWFPVNGKPSATAGRKARGLPETARLPGVWNMQFSATPSPAPRRRPGAAAGFTMVEAMITIIIIGIVAAVGLPRIDFEGAKANSAMRTVTLTFAHAQREAVSLQMDVWVAVDTVNRTLRLHEDRNNDGIIQNGERVSNAPLDEGVMFRTSGATALPFGAAVCSFTRTQGGLPAIVFHRDGTANESGGVYLTTAKAFAQNQAGMSRGAFKQRAVEIDQATGRAFWWTYANGTWVSGK